MKVGISIFFSLLACPVHAAELTTPSGVLASLYDVVMEPDNGIARYRFLVPDLAADASALAFVDLMADIQYLCDDVALPAVLAGGKDMHEIVISLSSAKVTFGEIAPEITQFFQPFAITDNTCVWEDF